MRLKNLVLAALFGSVLALPISAPVFAQTAAPGSAAPATGAQTPAVPAPAKPAVAAPAKPAKPVKPAKTEKTPFTGTVNINTGSAEDLDMLYGVGKARAAKIIAGRPYKAIDELSSRKILLQKTFDKIKGQLAV